jgi:hypothetical protein
MYGIFKTIIDQTSNNQSHRKIKIVPNFNKKFAKQSQIIKYITWKDKINKGEIRLEAYTWKWFFKIKSEWLPK